jgi:hypothetical protein
VEEFEGAGEGVGGEVADGVEAGAEGEEDAGGGEEAGLRRRG